MWRQKVLISFCAALALVGSAASSGYGEALSGQVRWDGLVELNEAVVVPPTATLVIAPGTRIVASTAQVRISVRGLLQVEGSASAPVVFSGAKGWQGVEFMEAPSGSSLRWAEFHAASSAISSYATDFKVENCLFRDNEYAIRLLRESSPLITTSTFENNQVGVANEMKSGAVIRDNHFTNHSRSAVLASHNSRGPVSGNTFTGNKEGVTLLQTYPDRIRQNVFLDNEVAIYCNQTQSTPQIEENRFEKNTYGVLNFSFAYPEIRNNRFVQNKTAVHNDQYGSPVLEHNLFHENETALYNYRKSNPQVRFNSFEKNGLALFCDFSAYPEVRSNHFLGNAMGVKLGIYQSADWEERSGSKAIMQREAAARQSQNPLLAQVPETFNDFVDVSGNWWGEDTSQFATLGAEGNSPLFYDRQDQPEVTYEDYGPGVYQLDWIKFSPWLEEPVDGVGPVETK